jgi:hypothetical protein
MALHKEVTAAKLSDDLVVDIVSRLMSKSFCRCKCAYKAWSAFSSDHTTARSSPKKVEATTGLLYHGCNKMHHYSLMDKLEKSSFGGSAWLVDDKWDPEITFT